MTCVFLFSGVRGAVGGQRCGEAQQEHGARGLEAVPQGVSAARQVQVHSYTAPLH